MRVYTNNNTVQLIHTNTIDLKGLEHNEATEINDENKKWRHSDMGANRSR